MRKHRIYLPQDIALGQDIVLNKETNHYISTVLRLKPAQDIVIFNGDGNEYTGQVYGDKRSLIVRPMRLSKTEPPSQHTIHLLQCIARGDHMDYAIQKATELGVHQITPIISERTQGHSEQRLEKRFKHWQGIITNACEQSGRCFVPTLHTIKDFHTAITSCKDHSKFICQRTHTTLTDTTFENSIAVLIGPEGGLTEDEIDHAYEQHYTAMSLGKHILRTETAATSAITLINFLSMHN